mgnify:FL=1
MFAVFAGSVEGLAVVAAEEEGEGVFGAVAGGVGVAGGLAGELGVVVLEVGLFFVLEGQFAVCVKKGVHWLSLLWQSGRVKT